MVGGAAAVLAAAVLAVAAVAAVAHGQARVQVLTISAAVTMTMFWRTAVKFVLVLIVAGLVMAAAADLTIIHDPRVLIP